MIDDQPDGLDEAERLLMELRPDLDEHRRDRMEQRLLGRRVRGARQRLVPVLALAAGLAALILILVTLGAGSLPSQTNLVNAEPNCSWIARSTTVQQPRIVLGSSSTSRTETVPQTVTRFVRHCR